MAATQDGLGRVARKRGIEGHGTQEILYTIYEATTGKWTDILRIQEKKAPKQRISLVAYITSKSQGFSFG